jgi:uncharacterized protein (TIGR03435 family)
MTGGRIVGGRYQLRHASLLDLIATAWNFPRERIIGGPGWLEKERFDIDAKVSRETAPAAFPSMLQALLRDRFRLKILEDAKAVTVLTLTAGKRNRLHPADGTLAGGCRQTQGSAVVNRSVQNAIVACGNMTMEEFAAQIPSIGGSYVTHEVVDRTGLAGAWDFTIEWTAQQLLGIAGPDGITFSEALANETGLELREQKIRMPVLVVESAQMPEGLRRDNSNRPMEFEAAVIRPSEPGTQERTRFLPGGRIDFRAVTLKDFIGLAWNIGRDDPIPGLAEEVGAQRFSIFARAPLATQTAGSGNGPPMDIDALRVMMRALLTDRFRMATHYEEQRAPAYVLTLEEPKLTKADPDNRSGCTQSLGNAGSGSARVSTFSYTCRNTTMAQLAEALQKASMADLTHPVIDETGLKGAWDFTLTWTPRALAPATTSSDPLPGIPLEQALDKQLGLKLELQKRPMQVLAIDRMDPKPTGN